MDMSATLHIFEALSEIGVKPESARNVERAIESAIQKGQNQVEKNILDKVMTKEDGHRLELKINAVELKLSTEIRELRSELHKALNTQLVWMISAMFTVAGLSIAAFKLL